MKKYPGRAMPLNWPTASRVQNLIGPNRFGIRVGKQGKFNLAAVREIFQDLFAVVADRREFDPLLLESCFGALQLDQLPFAVGSPIGGTEEEENRAVRSFQTFERLFLAELVASRKCGRFLSNGEPNRSEQLRERQRGSYCLRECPGR